MGRDEGRTRRPAGRRGAVRAAVAVGVLPLAKLAVDGASGHLGANPIAEIQDRLGFWALALLTATLAATPAHEWLGLGWPLRIRRALGLLAFTYATLHLVNYAAIDQFFDWVAIAADVEKRPFITVGFASLLLLVPLTVTSTDGWMRRLGHRRWKAVHRLVYPAALGGLVHFFWRVKADLRQPALFALVLGALALLRVVPSPARRRRARAATESSASWHEGDAPAGAASRSEP